MTAPAEPVTLYNGRTRIKVPADKKDALLETGLFTEQRTTTEQSLNKRVYVQEDEPKGAREGAIWVTP